MLPMKHCLRFALTACLSVTSSLSVALENARLFDETQRRTRESAALAEVGRDISSTLDVAKVMDRIAQLEDGGVQMVLNCTVGADLSFDAIRGQHDAVLIATGEVLTRRQSFQPFIDSRAIDIAGSPTR